MGGCATENITEKEFWDSETDKLVFKIEKEKKKKKGGTVNSDH